MISSKSRNRHVCGLFVVPMSSNAVIMHKQQWRRNLQTTKHSNIFYDAQIQVADDASLLTDLLSCNIPSLPRPCSDLTTENTIPRVLTSRTTANYPWQPREISLQTTGCHTTSANTTPHHYILCYTRNIYHRTTLRTILVNKSHHVLPQVHPLLALRQPYPNAHPHVSKEHHRRSNESHILRRLSSRTSRSESRVSTLRNTSKS